MAKDRVCGLPITSRVYLCGRVPVKAVVVVFDESVEAICENKCTDEYGVCVCVLLGGEFGELFVVSMNCRYGYDIEP